VYLVRQPPMKTNEDKTVISNVLSVFFIKMILFKATKILQKQQIIPI
jgi:hypothetical protein